MSDKEEAINTLWSHYRLPRSESFWWCKYPERAIKEISKMEINTRARLEFKGAELVWTETIITDFGKSYSFSIHSREDYPFKVPRVSARRTYGQAIAYAEGNHVYKSGNICLFHDDSYSSSISILDIRNLACAWCFCHDAQEQTGKWPGAEEYH